MNETWVTVVGNVASEVTARRVGAAEHLLAGFRVASSERRWDRESAAWTDGDRFSAWVTCWRRVGEHVRSSLVKGDPVVVRGRLSVREYESAGGERRFSTEITAIAVGPDLARCTAHVTRQKLAAVGPERPDTGGSDRSAEETSELAMADLVEAAGEATGVVPEEAVPEQGEDGPQPLPASA